MKTHDEGEFHVTVKEIFMHPGYPDTRNGIANDVCLLWTQNMANRKLVNSVYAAACLPTTAYEHGEACHVSGWGTTFSGGQTSNKMREVAVNLMSINFCNDPQNVHDDMVGKLSMIWRCVLACLMAMTTTHLLTLVKTLARVIRVDHSPVFATVNPLLPALSHGDRAALPLGNLVYTQTFIITQIGFTRRLRIRGSLFNKASVLF